ncbi:MAG: major facilitator superfamily 1 transporter [Gemmatimonadetes bacterium]|nr:major facilitator superfamily 1 transporter [Gemmatimonadota bacterium]
MINNPWRGLRGLPADVWIIVATSLVNRAGMMALPFLVLYLTKYLGVSASLAGLAITTYGIGGLITGPIAGRLCDRLGTFTVMRASLALTGVILLLIPLAHDFRLVVVLTFLWAVAADAVRPATLSGLTETVPPEQRKAAIALNRLSANLGMSIGPAVGGFLAMVSFPMLFVVDGVTSLAAAGVLSALLWYRARNAAPRLPRPAPRESARSDAATKSAVWHDRAARVLFLAVFLVGVVFMQHQGAMPLYFVRDLHYRESFYGMLFVLNTLIIVAIEVPVNLAMSHWPHRRSLMLGALLTACGFGAMGFAHSSLALAATVVVWTFGEMIFFPASTAYVADIAPAGRTGEYMGGYASMFSLSMIVGPWAGTASLDRFGPAATWAGVFACGLLAVGVIAAARHQPSAVLSAEPR